MAVERVAFGALVRKMRNAMNGGKGISGEALASAVFGNADRKGDISNIETGKAKSRPETIRNLCAVLGIRAPDLPGLEDILSFNTDDDRKILEDLRNENGTLAMALENRERASRDQLIAMAVQFGWTSGTIPAEGDLRRFLDGKAEDYRRVRAEVEAIPETMLRLSNIKAAAKAAFAAGNMDEVESLLSLVQTVEVEEAARTAESRADVALLRNRVADAFKLLSAAADFFAIVDPTEPGKRRDSYFERLFRHGERYGGTGLSFAVQMGRDAVARLDRETDAMAWASANQNLAIALRNQGTRTAGEAGTALLAQAVAAYRQALTVLTRADHPVQWAMTTQNLAGALQTQGTRTAGEAGTALLAQAVAAYREALTVRTRADHPVQWAGTMQNLAIALKNQGTRTGGEAGIDLLAEAVAAYREALTVRTRADHPVDWAMTTQNLAGALQTQGTRTAGEAGTDLLAQAVAAYREALTVRTRADHPVDWAMTQENLAICQQAWADHPACTDPLLHLRAALDHVDAALTVYDPVHMPYDHGTATALRAEILAAFGPDAP